MVSAMAQASTFNQQSTGSGECPPAWQRAPRGHFFDDIDTVLAKLVTPHADELSRLYEHDDHNIDPLSPVGSDDDEPDLEWEEGDPHSDQDSVGVGAQQQQLFGPFDYIDADFVRDISDCVNANQCLTDGQCKELCPDEFARSYVIDSSQLRCHDTTLPRKMQEEAMAKRLGSLLYDLHGGYSQQLLSALAHYLKHRLPAYKALLRHYLNGHVNKQLFDTVLVRLFAQSSTNSNTPALLFELHNQFILSLWPSPSKVHCAREREMQPFCDIDLKLFAKLYHYQKRKRTKAVFSDLFHAEVPEMECQAPSTNVPAGGIEYSTEIDNLQTEGPVKHQRCLTPFLNTKHYMDQFWTQNNNNLLDPDTQNEQSEEAHRQMLILQKIWLTELTHAYGIEFGLESFERYDITQTRFKAWLKAQVKHFELERIHSKNGHKVRFLEMRIHTPSECDEDFCPMLISLRKLPPPRINSHPVPTESGHGAHHRELLSFRGLELKLSRTMRRDMEENKILFVDKRAVYICHLALLKFLRSLIRQLVERKAAFRNMNKRFDRLRVIDAIVPKAKTEYYSDLVKEINANSLEDILLTEEDRQFSHNLFYRSMLENEHFDIGQNPLNELDVLAALQNSPTLIPNRQVWTIIKRRLISKLESASNSPAISRPSP